MSKKKKTKQINEVKRKPRPFTIVSFLVSEVPIQPAFLSPPFRVVVFVLFTAFLAVLTERSKIVCLPNLSGIEVPCWALVSR